jgi:hypothetical protein
MLKQSVWMTFLKIDLEHGQIQIRPLSVETRQYPAPGAALIRRPARRFQPQLCRWGEIGSAPIAFYYRRRLLSHASLISKTTIVTMLVTKIGPANIATSVSIFFQRGGCRPGDKSHSFTCEAVSA